MGKVSAMSKGSRLGLGTILGVILVPMAVLLVMLILNQSDSSCTEGGAEDSLGCTLRLVAITGLSIPAGALIGLLVAFVLGKRPRS
jgi:hypothetical protein